MPFNLDGYVRPGASLTWVRFWRCRLNGATRCCWALYCFSCSGISVVVAAGRARRVLRSIWSAALLAMAGLRYRWHAAAAV